MSSKVFWCLLFGYMHLTNLQAQLDLKDSLKALLHQPMPDSSKAKILCKLGAQYMISNPDTALLYSKQGLALAQKTGFAEGEIIGLNQTASIFNITGNYPAALHYFLEALKKAEAIQNRHRMGASLLNIGSVYYYQGDYQTAIIYSLEARKIFDSLHEPAMIMTAALNLGEYYEKSNKLDSANHYTQQAAGLATSLNDEDFAGMSLNNLGNIYTKMEQPQIALGFYRSGLSKLIQVENDDAICECSLGMARIFAKQGMADSALYYGHLSVRTAGRGKFTNRLLKAATFLAGHYEAIGQTDSAYAYLKAANAAKDSLFSQERQREIQNLTFSESLRQQEKAEELLALKHERTRNMQYIILGIAVIGFSVFILLISRTLLINEKWVSFLAVMGLLLVFEFLNLLLHPLIVRITHHSPFYMFVISVLIAAFLIPLHHKSELMIRGKLVEKNKRHRLAVAKRIVRKLDRDAGIRHVKE